MVVTPYCCFPPHTAGPHLGHNLRNALVTNISSGLMMFWKKKRARQTLAARLALQTFKRRGRDQTTISPCGRLTKPREYHGNNFEATVNNMRWNNTNHTITFLCRVSVAPGFYSFLICPDFLSSPQKQGKNQRGSCQIYLTSINTCSSLPSGLFGYLGDRLGIPLLREEKSTRVEWHLLPRCWPKVVPAGLKSYHPIMACQ